MATKKVGRPTDNVKDFMLRTRMDKETVDKLEYLSKELNYQNQKLSDGGLTNSTKKLKNRALPP